MAEAIWNFPKLGEGQGQGYTDSGIETFKGNELIDNIAREICQNSLDAKNRDNNNPVKVHFNLKTINKKDFPLFEDYYCYMQGCQRFWEHKDEKQVTKFIQRVFNVFAKDTINFLIVSDYNTNGLINSDAAPHEKSVWRALVCEDGVSVKGENSGGSYGIGKNAPFACSDISLVFYNTYAKDGKEAFQGVARVATLYDKDNEMTQSIGHFKSNEKYKPITPGIKCAFRDMFKREEYGTDIIIAGCEKFTSTRNWQEKLKQAIIKNFFLAIYEKQLVVSVENEEINSDNLSEYINKYRNVNNECLLTAQLFETFTNPDEYICENILGTADLGIYLKADKNYKRKIAKFRLSGMLVGKSNGQIIQNFNAVIVVRGKELDALLRLTEPPKHNKWEYSRVDDDTLKEKVKMCIRLINEKVKKLIDKKYKITPEDSVDGGVGEYLPDDINDLSHKQKGDDKLKPIVQLTTKPKTNKLITEDNPLPEFHILGNPDSVSGEETGIRDFSKKRELPTSPLPPPIDKIEKEEQFKQDIAGKKHYKIHRDFNYKRIFPKNYNQGLYQVVLSSKNDIERLFINFAVIGEGASKDSLKTIQYHVDGQNIPINDSKIGPLKLIANESKEIFVTFENKEKMVINMDIFEEVFE